MGRIIERTFQITLFSRFIHFFKEVQNFIIISKLGMLHKVWTLLDVVWFSHASRSHNCARCLYLFLRNFLIYFLLLLCRLLLLFILLIFGAIAATSIGLLILCLKVVIRRWTRKFVIICLVISSHSLYQHLILEILSAPLLLVLISGDPLFLLSADLFLAVIHVLL